MTTPIKRRCYDRKATSFMRVSLCALPPPPTLPYPLLCYQLSISLTRSIRPYRSVRPPSFSRWDPSGRLTACLLLRSTLSSFMHDLQQQQRDISSSFHSNFLPAVFVCPWLLSYRLKLLAFVGDSDLSLSDPVQISCTLCVRYLPPCFLRMSPKMIQMSSRVYV